MDTGKEQLPLSNDVSFSYKNAVGKHVLWPRAITTLSCDWFLISDWHAPRSL